MIYSLIFKDLTDESIQTIGKKINPPVFAKIGARLDAQETRETLNSLATINNEALIINLGSVDEAVVTEALHTYRIQRPETRIIIYAPGRQPGDLLMAQLVGLGIYDLIVPEEYDGIDLVKLIADALTQTPAGYAQAARFSKAGLMLSGYRESRKPDTQTKVVERFVETQRPIGLVTVAIAGAFPGAGCTHTALAVSHYIFRLGHKAIQAKRPSEHDDSNEYNSIVHVHDGRETNIEGCASVHGFDIIFESARDMSNIFSRIQGHGYEYLVLDLGCLDSFSRSELNRSELPVLVTSASSWRLPDLAPVVQYNNEEARNWTVAVNAPSRSNLEYFSKTFQEHFSRIEELPFFPDPFNLDENVAEYLSRLLDPILPGRGRRRKRSWLPWKR